MMEAHEYIFVKRKIEQLTGIDLDCYKRAQMERRLRTYLLRSGQASWPAFFRAMQDSPAELGKLRDYLTINVSYFFRDPEKFDYLREQVVPELLRGRTKLQVWSAGCSNGHEPYSLAILLAEGTSIYRQHRILATDIDRSALELAEAGGPYTIEEVAPIPPEVRSRYFTFRDDRYWFTSTMRRKITFQHHNLLVDAPPSPPSGEAGYDLIVCRNVVIYFTAEHKQNLYQRLYDALRPGGVLFVGGTEVISRAADLGFEVMNMSFYRRNDGMAGPQTYSFAARAGAGRRQR
ncbi:MAG: protein-glutamate O-methyltransferase CheR [Anaerolineae bacterium]|jgi:chemotaxis protein methyltransferase CheR